MKKDILENIFCENDADFRVYCSICDILCIERFHKNHHKSGTDITNIRKKQHLSNLKFFISNNLVQIKMKYYCSVCEKSISNKMKD